MSTLPPSRTPRSSRPLEHRTVTRPSSNVPQNDENTTLGHPLTRSMVKKSQGLKHIQTIVQQELEGGKTAMHGVKKPTRTILFDTTNHSGKSDGLTRDQNARPTAVRTVLGDKSNNSNAQTKPAVIQKAEKRTLDMGVKTTRGGTLRSGTYRNQAATTTLVTHRPKSRMFAAPVQHESPSKPLLHHPQPHQAHALRSTVTSSPVRLRTKTPLGPTVTALQPRKPSLEAPEATTSVQAPVPCDQPIPAISDQNHKYLMDVETTNKLGKRKRMSVDAIVSQWNRPSEPASSDLGKRRRSDGGVRSGTGRLMSESPEARQVVKRSRVYVSPLKPLPFTANGAYCHQAYLQPRIPRSSQSESPADGDTMDLSQVHSGESTAPLTLTSASSVDSMDVDGPGTTTPTERLTPCRTNSNTDRLGTEPTPTKAVTGAHITTTSCPALSSSSSQSTTPLGSPRASTFRHSASTACPSTTSHSMPSTTLTSPSSTPPKAPSTVVRPPLAQKTSTTNVPVTSRRQGLDSEWKSSVSGLEAALAKLKVKPRPSLVASTTGVRRTSTTSASLTDRSHKPSRENETSENSTTSKPAASQDRYRRHARVSIGTGSRSLPSPIRGTISAISTENQADTSRVEEASGRSLASVPGMAASSTTFGERFQNVMDSVTGTGCLKGVVAYVDVRTTEGDDAGTVFVEILKYCGAKVLASQTSSCTHIIFKSGKPSTIAWWNRQESKPFLVGSSWVTKCKETGVRVDEKPYAVNVAELEIFKARRRSMEPRRLQSMQETSNVQQVKTPVSSKNTGILSAIAQAKRQQLQYAPTISSPLKKSFRVRSLSPSVEEVDE